MQCSVFTFRLNNTTGTQTVTGIADKDGNAFTPEYIGFINGSSELNILWANGSDLKNTATINFNFYRASDGAAGYNATGHLPQFGAKIGSGAGGTGTNSALDTLEADSFFGGNVYRTCRINSVSSGQFELEVLTTTAWAFDTDVMCVAIANAGDLLIETAPAAFTNAGTKALGYETKGVWWALNGGLATGSPGNPAAGAGGSAIGWGFDTPNGGPYSTAMHIVNQGNNYRHQRDGIWDGSINGTGTAYGRAYVSTWGATDLTISHKSPNLATALSGPYLVSGSTVLCASGTFRQPTTAGLQSIDLGINPAFILFTSTGILNDSVTVDSNWAELSSGWTDRVNQQCFWIGESRNGNVLPLYGGNLFTDTELIRFVDSAGPNGTSTTFGSTASLVSVDDQGTVVIDWTLVDGTQRDVNWFAIGIAAVTGSLEYTKVWDASVTNEPTITLNVGSSPGASDVATASGTGAVTISDGSISPGTYYLSESGQGRYIRGNIVCTTNGSPLTVGTDGEIVINGGDAVVCTITNTYTPAGTRPNQWKLYQFTMKTRREETR